VLERLTFLSTVRINLRRIAFASKKDNNFLHCNSGREKGDRDREGIEVKEGTNGGWLCCW
jgi:hypothetical protein